MHLSALLLLLLLARRLSFAPTGTGYDAPRVAAWGVAAAQRAMPVDEATCEWRLPRVANPPACLGDPRSFL